MNARPEALPDAARVLIVRMGALGDIIHALPLLAAIRASRPDISVDWLVDARYAQVLALVEGVRQRVIVRAGDDARTTGEVRFAGVPGIAPAIRHLRHQRYDVAIDLQGLLKSAALAWSAGTRRVIGFEPAQLREPAARWFHGESIHGAAHAHVVHKNLAMLPALGLPVTAPQFPWRDVASEVPTAVMQDARVARADGFAVINPGAAWPNKRWPPARFGALAALLGERLNLASVVTWGPGEHAQAEDVLATSRGHAVLAPPSALHDLLALARRASLVVSGDTGPLHLAASVGAPIVALFGPTRPERNGPWDAADGAVSRAGQCQCLHKRRCLRGTPCIEQIEVEEVYAACAQRLGAVTLA